MIVLTFFCAIFLFLMGLIVVPSGQKRKAAQRIEVYLDADQKRLKGQETMDEERQKGQPFEKGRVEAVRWQKNGGLTKGSLGTSGQQSGEASAGKNGRVVTVNNQMRFLLLARSLWIRLARRFKKNIRIKDVERLERKLWQAGSPLGMSPIDYRLAQLFFISGIPVFLGFWVVLLHIPEAKSLLVIVVGLLYACLLLPFYIRSRIKKRATSALRELPDFVDLLTVSLEAGLGFDAALTKVIEKQKGVLSDEFRQCLDEIRLGKTRREGLTGIKQRLEVDELSTLISSVIRAEKLGVGMVQVLRVQASEVREKRKQRAEEKAMKAPIKMLFPLVLFIFPSLFIIILGPAVIQIMKIFTGH